MVQTGKEKLTWSSERCLQYTLSLEIELSGLMVVVNGVYRHVQQYFSYIVTVRFIGGGNQSTPRKPPTCQKSLTNFIT
jgi:hypothetical protein